MAATWRASDGDCGNGVASDKPAFKKQWDKIRQEFSVRANICVDGSNYAKYGTTFDNQRLVIDKSAPTTGTIITGKVVTVGQLPALLEGVRNDRQRVRMANKMPLNLTAARFLEGAGLADRNGGADLDALGDGQRDQASGAGTRPAVPGAEGSATAADDALTVNGGDRLPGQPGVAGRGSGTGGATGERSGRDGNSAARGNSAAGTPVQREGGDGAVKNGVTMARTESAPSTDAMIDAIFQELPTAAPVD